MRLLANIAYHHSPEKTKNLLRVVETIRSYPADVIDIFVDTNDPRACIRKEGMKVVAHTDMNSPWELTSKHRRRILEEYGKYDWVAYFEDDMMLPAPAFANFVRQFGTMFREGMYPSFARIETYPDREGQFSPDIISELDESMWSEWNGKRYVSPPFYINYHAFWMFSSECLGQVLESDPDALSPESYDATYREKLASFPIWRLGLKPMLELDGDGSLSELCKAYHLTNNYEDRSIDIRHIFRRR